MKRYKIKKNTREIISVKFTEIGMIDKYINIEKKDIDRASKMATNKIPNINVLLLKGASAILTSTFLCILKSKNSRKIKGYRPKEPIININPGKTQKS